MVPRLPVACLGAGVALLASLGVVRAGEPAAIIENISADSLDLAFMDYLEEGQIIDLKAGESLTLGYLTSCWVEKILGGRVVVGREKSIVENGEVNRKRVECDGGALRLTPQEAAKSGVIVFRRPRGDDGNAAPRLQITLYGTSPVIRLAAGGAGTVVIERLDQSGERHVLTMDGRYLDLAQSEISLAPGGIYGAAVGESRVVFKIDSLAAPGATPVIGRLLHL